MSINRQDYFLPGIQDKKPSPVRLLWILTIILVVALILIGVLGWRYYKNTLKQIPDITLKGNTDSTLKGFPDNTLKGKPDTVTRQIPDNIKGKYYYGGQPKVTTYSNPILVLTNIGYVVGYDEKRKNPAWGCYRLFKVANLVAPPRPKSFKTDMRTFSRVKTQDYTSSGYDRGHLGAPNFAIGVCYGVEAQEETFLMSNITPQKPRMNQDIFENMERMEIREYAQKYEEIWIISGNIFDNKIEKLKSGVEIPDACYHVVVDEDRGKIRTLAFLIPQNVTGKEQLIEFLTTVDDIEIKTGLDLLSDLPDEIEHMIEAEKTRMW